MIVRLVAEVEVEDERDASAKFIELVPFLLANDWVEAEGVSIRVESGALVAGDAIGVPSPASSAIPHAPEAGGPPPMPSPGPPAPRS